MTTDIITNHQPPDLAETIRAILPACQSAKFAVGYFFLSGFTAIADQLDNVQELRLLIGSASSAETVEQIAEGARRLQEAQHALESASHPKSVVSQERQAQTSAAVGGTAAAMLQSSANQRLICSLANAIAENGSG
jgi:hypothetical protein